MEWELNELYLLRWLPPSRTEHQVWDAWLEAFSIPLQESLSRMISVTWADVGLCSRRFFRPYQGSEHRNALTVAWYTGFNSWSGLSIQGARARATVVVPETAEL